MQQELGSSALNFPAQSSTTGGTVEITDLEEFLHQITQGKAAKYTDGQRECFLVCLRDRQDEHENMGLTPRDQSVLLDLSTKKDPLVGAGVAKHYNADTQAALLSPKKSSVQHLLSLPSVSLAAEKLLGLSSKLRQIRMQQKAALDMVREAVLTLYSQRDTERPIAEEREAFSHPSFAAFLQTTEAASTKESISSTQQQTRTTVSLMSSENIRALVSDMGPYSSVVNEPRKLDHGRHSFLESDLGTGGHSENLDNVLHQAPIAVYRKSPQQLGQVEKPPYDIPAKSQPRTHSHVTPAAKDIGRPSFPRISINATIGISPAKADAWLNSQLVADNDKNIVPTKLTSPYPGVHNSPAGTANQYSAPAYNGKCEKKQSGVKYSFDCKIRVPLQSGPARALVGPEETRNNFRLVLFRDNKPVTVIEGKPVTPVSQQQPEIFESDFKKKRGGSQQEIATVDTVGHASNQRTSVGRKFSSSSNWEGVKELMEKIIGES